MAEPLIFDADDTLWDEQRTLQAFEREIDAIVTRIAGPDVAFIARFLEAEERNIPHIGYGFASYTYSLAETLATFPDYPSLREEVLSAYRGLYDRLANEPPPLLPGVRETLEELRRRGHRMFVLTRGIPAEQKHKMELSGLEHVFEAVRIVQRKDVDAYRGLCRDHGLDRVKTTMIGNSLRSDVLPALHAGLAAVWIPADTPWQHDAASEPLPNGARRVARFSDLAALLATS
ncbi:HAD family hydrolase [Salinarimonas ramus]|uniref:Haloacid dehalogenase n=1 Tax=Salinarimonas ramus TaxID=690164 RepID=A0A917V3F6_9HYPH|nr:HAD family hydrolase [Salinarimonas ramus]GGK31707.1 haloacid dehalogenase [Salinarimonas ramus]